MDKCNVIDCDVYHAIKLIKPRYASVFIYSLDDGPKSFSMLKEEFDYINSTQVVRTLNHLINTNLVIKDDSDYRLTSYGQKLVPILDSLNEWYVQS